MSYLPCIGAFIKLRCYPKTLSKEFYRTTLSPFISLSSVFKWMGDSLVPLSSKKEDREDAHSIPFFFEP